MQGNGTQGIDAKGGTPQDVPLPFSLAYPCSGQSRIARFSRRLTCDPVPQFAVGVMARAQRRRRIVAARSGAAAALIQPAPMAQHRSLS
jgi:hypothetical protein